MSEPLAFLNGQFVPDSQAVVPVSDLGLVQGATVTETIRTFNGEPFRLEAHLERLQHSLQAVGFPTSLTPQKCRSIVLRLIEHNYPLLPQGHDLGIVVFVTAGKNLTYLGAAAAAEARTPTTCVHTFPLPFELWADKLEQGQHLVTPARRHISPETLDPRIKHRSRLHWYLADQEVRAIAPEASALLLDQQGFVTETSTANFFIVRDREILAPSSLSALEGVSQQVVFELAERLNFICRFAPLRPYDVANADEAFTSSTPYCLLPVTRFNGKPIGSGRPGEVFKSLLAEWSKLVGLDIAEQIRRVAAERTADSRF